MGVLEVQQTKCPPQLVKPEVEWPWPAVNSPPPTTRTGWQVRDALLVGERCWIIQYGIYHDAEFGLWCQGTVNVRWDPDDGGEVLIERTADGVRVLDWPAEDAYGHPNRIKLQRVNSYGPGDCWVVEFPQRWR